MKKQPVLKVGIMAEKLIRFQLETGYRHEGTIIKQGIYTAELKGREIVLEGEDVLIISLTGIDLFPLDRESSFLLKDVTIGIQFHWEQKENQRFTGGVRFIAEDHKIRVINILKLEDYLESVVSSEMSATSSPALLQAHAIISRSWLLAQIMKNKLLSNSEVKYNSCTTTENEITKWYDREDHVNFDVCADDHCQRYHGNTKIINQKATAAVAHTFGEVLISENEICDARFSKCCGGVSESFENNWEPLPKPYLTTVGDCEPLSDPPETDLRIENEAHNWILANPEAFCNTTDLQILAQVLPGFDQKTHDFFRWKVEYTQNELSALLLKKSGIDFGSIIWIEPVERGFSGRITRLRIVGSKKTMVVGKELEIRKWLSPSHLYSSGFVVGYDNYNNGIPGKIILTGAGWGHGVGLCQIGAAVMGEKGYNYRQILAHYFKNSKLEKLYDQ